MMCEGSIVGPLGTGKFRIPREELLALARSAACMAQTFHAVAAAFPGDHKRLPAGESRVRSPQTSGGVQRRLVQQQQSSRVPAVCKMHHPVGGRPVGTQSRFQILAPEWAAPA
ncbi:hypothetical protein GGTG_08643 [Gaeumannomyces tritici R3-111a-1]|uniref:Uncharacterized protein n=1 Tax=Gaeumannomyces tritici (strain R3-111a-1) TaxID=644352 RepID=J3P557_GAET3|nr:hypothetical protein GGTG_08643 [Gaeumannomyces tritici R3-111a-1]EJT74805.1 hypothetical protein GGTG_08643 [Gaeumannomyces tritici R3-111a-1]